MMVKYNHSTHITNKGKAPSFSPSNTVYTLQATLRKKQAIRAIQGRKHVKYKKQTRLLVTLRIIQRLYADNAQA